MYEAVPAVSELNRVKGFDPLKYLRRTENGVKLDLKMKKLWFRLKYPNGRIKLSALKITDQFALIEARVYFDKNDPEPVASFTAQRESKTTPGGLYVEAAQYVAADRALTDAGFGIQLVPVPAGQEVTFPVTVQAAEQQAPDKTEPKSVQQVVPAEEQPPAAGPATAAEAVVTNEPVPAVETVQLPAQERPVEKAPADEVPADEVSAQVSNEDVTASHEDMTLEEAGNMIVPSGTCKGWTLQQVMERRPMSLKWFVTAYSGDNEMFRKAAKMVYDKYEMMKAA